MILRLLCEGNSIRSTSRITGCHTKTVGDTILAYGHAAGHLLDDYLTGMTLRHVEVDEMWTYVAKKQARLTVDERRERHDIGDIFLWTCVDQDSKLIASHLVGKRSADNARRLMMDLARRIEIPRPHDADNPLQETDRSGHRFACHGHAVPRPVDGRRTQRCWMLESEWLMVDS